MRPIDEAALSGPGDAAILPDAINCIVPGRVAGARLPASRVADVERAACRHHHGGRGALVARLHLAHELCAAAAADEPAEDHLMVRCARRE